MSPPRKRLHCIVEGRGEVEAVPALCSRVLHHLEAWAWSVVPDPIRHARSSLVRDGAPNERELRRLVELARRRPADAVLVLCDADDDCPATWAPASERVVREILPGACVMAMREYEAWLLAAKTGSRLVGKRPIEDVRDAKGHFARVWPGYKPSVDQLTATREIDVERLRTLAPSFDKLVRSIDALVRGG